MSILNDGRQFGTDAEREEWEQEVKREYRQDEYEVWNGMGGRKTYAPKGTFEKIYNECKDDEEDE